MAATQRLPDNHGKGLLKSSVIFSSMTLLPCLFGLIRDMVIAYFFGAGPVAKAFVVAFHIPNLSRRLFAAGAFAKILSRF